MDQQNEEGLSLAKVVLPSGILEYFSLSNIVQTEEILSIYRISRNSHSSHLFKSLFQLFGLFKSLFNFDKDTLEFA
jgi:hypothetical protein